MTRFAALALLASLATGCFTTGGAIIGSRKKIESDSDDTYAVRGAVIGAGLDLLLVVLFKHALDNTRVGFDLGPGEPAIAMPTGRR